MEEWKFCEDKTATISVSSSSDSCNEDSMSVMEINVDARKMKPCVPGIKEDKTWANLKNKFRLRVELNMSAVFRADYIWWRKQCWNNSRGIRTVDRQTLSSARYAWIPEIFPHYGEDGSVWRN